MPRVTVTVSEEVARKIAYVRAAVTYDRSDSALINRAIIEYLLRFDDPSAEQRQLMLDQIVPETE